MRVQEKKYIILGSLCALILTLSVGYAAFNSVLKIKGTSNITSEWNILITNVEEINKGGEAITTEKEGVTNPNWDGLTANIEADLFQKGDYIEYEVTVENRGTLDAKLNEIKTNTTKEHEAILISFSGYTKGEKLEKGTSHKIIVRIEYNPEFEGIPEIGSKELNIELEYNQNDDYKKEENGEVSSPDRYLVKYDCITNGGEKCTDYNEYLKEGESIDLTHKGPNKKYDFIGWNTDKDAKEGIKELQMGTEEITLYAIYQGDPIIRSWGGHTATDFHTDAYRQSIISAEFLDHKNVPENAVESWDVSEAQDGSVMAWVIADETDNTKHHLYIGGKDGVIANEASSYLFNQFQKIETINFNNNFDTSNTTSMYMMFCGAIALKSIKFGDKFVTDKVTTMNAMFGNNYALTDLDVSNFNTSNVTNMYNMFASCRSLTSLNLSNFDTSKVTNMAGMFYNCFALTKLSLCSWDTNKVTAMDLMFLGSSKLTKIYVGPNWSTANASINRMFEGAGTSAVTQSNNCMVDAEDPATIKVTHSSTTNSITLIVDAYAESGIAKYEYQIDGGDWIESTENIHTFTGLEQNKGYSIKVRVTSKVGKQTIATPVLSLDGITKVTSFSASNTEQTYLTPVYGKYKLETWGAQGGSYNSSVIGGYGGYATGTIELQKDKKLYLNVGKQGTEYYKVADGLHNVGRGGGSTQITLSSGALSTFQNKKDEVLIVAGGGGGSYYHDSGYYGSGGAGGGYIGGQGYANKTKGAHGGTQSSGGLGIVSGSFGLPGIRYNAGGGYGWYGGGTVDGGIHDYGLAGSGGGSGYIGNSLLQDKVMYCHNCGASNAVSTKTISTTNVSGSPVSNYAKSGDGYAKITLLESKGLNTAFLDVPTFEEIENESNKEVTIIYPEGCGTKYTCSYKKDDESWEEVNTSTKTVTYNSSGMLIAKIVDGFNTISSSYTVVCNDL